MTVYVDEPKHEVKRGWRKFIMCHMLADSMDELIAMADKIGVNRKYIQMPKHARQVPHFDICRTKRALAIMHGAFEVTCRQMVRVRRRIVKNANMSKVWVPTFQTAEER